MLFNQNLLLPFLVVLIRVIVNIHPYYVYMCVYL